MHLRCRIYQYDYSINGNDNLRRKSLSEYGQTPDTPNSLEYFHCCMLLFTESKHFPHFLLLLSSNIKIKLNVISMWSCCKDASSKYTNDEYLIQTKIKRQVE